MAEPKTTSAKTVSKSDFIRQRPAVLSAAEVVARGKAEGIEFAPQLVYRVRGSAMKKRKPAKRAATARATKPASAASSKPTLPSKSDFIRAQAATLSAAEVVAKAKAQGIKIDPALVYKVWGRPCREFALDRPGYEAECRLRQVTEEQGRLRARVPQPVAKGDRPEGQGRRREVRRAIRLPRSSHGQDGAKSEESCRENDDLDARARKRGPALGGVVCSVVL